MAYAPAGPSWHRFLCLFLALVATASAQAGFSEWREMLVPSVEAEHSGGKPPWLAPGAPSFLMVSDALQRIQANNNITEDYLTTLPGLPQVITLKLNMSDGVGIWTRVVNPWPHNRRKPACFVRSPYGSFATQNLALIYMALNGHAAVMQETRGTWSSGGNFDLWRGSSQDARDTFDWVLKQDWSDGEIYSMGASADGIDAVEETLMHPKSLHGQWLIWTTASGHHFIYPGGAYRKDLMEGYLESLAIVSRGVSEKVVLPATEEHEAMGPWWYNLTDCASRVDPSMKPGCRFTEIKWPMIISGAWWDLFHHTAVDMWLGLRALSDPSHRDDHVLIFSPLGHNIAGTLDVGIMEATRLRAAEVDSLVVAGELTSEFWRWFHCASEWFPKTCRCQGRVRFGVPGAWSEPKLVHGSVQCSKSSFGGHDPAPGKRKECQCQQATGPLRRRIGRVNLFIMGSFGSERKLGPGNYWTSLDDFPPFKATPFYLQPGAALGDSPPNAPGSASYTYDPKQPTPMVGGNNLPMIGSIKFAGSADQTERDERPDVIIFDSAPLAEPLAIVGRVSARLFVSSSAPDTDFFVTLSDLHADGSKVMMVRYGMQRMRWRESETNRSAPMVAGQVYEVGVTMWYTGYIFPQGHRIRVSISSAAYPYFDRTSNTGENDMTAHPVPIVAKNSVHFSEEHPSTVTLPVVSLGDIPENPHFTAAGPFERAAAPPAPELVI